jgi:N6-L-threonylcarbamoyladenine synthase
MVKKCILGIDTSNYTTSAALYDIQDKNIIFRKQLLPVKSGNVGLRQSEALFNHIKQLPIILKDLIKDVKCDIISIGVSEKPRNIEGSYMPCFLAGNSIAESLATILDVPLYKTSHQINHILSALYSVDRMDLIHESFFAFHVSGGTTDCLKVMPDNENVLSVSQIATSLDLNAGQAIDRVGVAMGIQFPCGKEIEKLSNNSTMVFKEKIKLKNGNCCLSGLENKCKSMMQSEKFSNADVARYCLSYIASTIIKMTESVPDIKLDDSVVYAGGVMSDKFISNMIANSIKNKTYFAKADYSCDNAVGTSLYAAIKSGNIT